MTKAINTIVTALNEMFAELDAKVLAKSQEWAKGRVAAIKEFQASGELRNEYGRIIDQHKYYTRLFLIAGGKTWYGIFNGRNAAMIEEFMIKNCAATVEKRNAMIARKLAKAEVTEIVSSEFAQSKDGFNGTFVVETNSGRKVVTIDTIGAGGYNIQCYHLRVLCKVR